MMFDNETLVAVAVLALTTAIATDYIVLPFAAFSSPLAIAVMVIAALGAFRSYPAVGFALFLLTAVLFFKRNAARVFSEKTNYGDASIPAERMGDAVRYGSDASQPRQYDQFRETDPANPMLGPIREGFSSAPGIADGDGGGPIGLDSEAGAPVGSYPLDKPRAQGAPEPRDFVYRPEPDTGDNTFVPVGKPMEDTKTTAFKY
jgi:hypothetical protein